MKRALVWSLCVWFAGLVMGEEKKPLMHFVEDDSKIVAKRGEKLIFQYNKKPTEEAAKHEPHFTRSGYIHPVYSPSGKEVTGDYAEDHKHQHGLFFAWTKTKFEGRKTEFWNQKLKAGRVSFSKRHDSETFNDVTMCQIIVEQLWEDITAPGGPKPVLKETWKITTHDAGEDRFVFDIESAQWLIGEKPLTIEKYHYGGMAIRGNDQWLNPDKDTTPPATMLTSEGLGRIEGNHSRPKWVAMSGLIDGENTGVAVLSHPKNFRFPQWVRLHPNKPYFVFAPMVEEPFQITTGKPYVSRYRYVVWDGSINAEELDSRWDEYGE